MQYQVNVSKRDDVCTVETIVLDDTGSVLLSGSIDVGTDDEVLAKQYAEEVFLPDLRINFPKKIAGLELPIDTPVIPEQPPIVDATIPVSDTNVTP